jgi:hypothetical protein
MIPGFRPSYINGIGNLVLKKKLFHRFRFLRKRFRIETTGSENHTPVVSIRFLLTQTGTDGYLPVNLWFTPSPPHLLQRRHKRNRHQEKKRRGLKDGEKGKKKGRESQRERETVKEGKRRR